jgi:serine/threonine protein phosphatase PrpC
MSIDGLPEPEIHSCSAGRAITFSMPCPGHERENEDALAVIPLGDSGLLLAVADGLGGQPEGAKAARIALEILAAAIGREDDHPREAILNGIEQANREIQALGVGAGTTLAVVEIRERRARAYHVGDSEILIVGQRGRLRFQSVPHSPVGYGVEAGLIDRREALDHEERHLLLNVVGSQDMSIDIGPVVKLRARDVVLVASDGLYDNLHRREIVEVIRKGKLLSSAEALTSSAIGRMTAPVEGEPSKPDDLTFILYRRSKD